MANGAKKVFVTALDQAYNSDLEGLGVIRWEGNKCYKWMQYDTGTVGTAGVAGEVAAYYTIDGYKNNQVTSDYSDTEEIGAGVLQAAMTDGQYGWFQIKGPATLSIAPTAGSDGDPLTVTGAGDGTLDVNIATAANAHICAWAGDISDNEILCDFPF